MNLNIFQVEPSAFASGAMVSTMLKEMEDIFATRFGMFLSTYNPCSALAHQYHVDMT
jgi:hypothetical protein